MVSSERGWKMSFNGNGTHQPLNGRSLLYLVAHEDQLLPYQ
jgi:hypothetical protein